MSWEGAKMAHWAAAVAALKFASLRVYLHGQLRCRGWISVVGSTAAEVKSGIQHGNETAVTHFYLV